MTSEESGAPRRGQGWISSIKCAARGPRDNFLADRPAAGATLRRMPRYRRLAPLLLAAAFPAAAALANLRLLLHASDALTAMEESTRNYILSSSQFADPTQSPPDALIDGQTETGVNDLGGMLVGNVAFCRGRSFAFDLRCPFVQWAGPLSHRAARPPQADPLRAIWVVAGAESSAGRPARPRRVRLAFFREALTDFDRSHIPPQPAVYWTELSVTLQDTAGPQRIDLSGLPAPRSSARFPDGVDRIFVRLEVLDIYPGQGAAAAKLPLGELSIETEYSFPPPGFAEMKRSAMER